MIYTVTFNPAIDYVVRLDRPLEVGEVNRAKGADCVLGCLLYTSRLLCGSMKRSLLRSTKHPTGPLL